MKVNSIAGLTCYVEDLTRTAAFYDAIGFRRGKEEPEPVDVERHTISKGMKPDGEPQVRPSGNREFVLRDPDGYRLAFFEK